MTSSASQTTNHPTMIKHQRLHLVVEGISLDLAVVRRCGCGESSKTPILFLHGWGSSKEDYTDIQLQPAFLGRPFITYDAPGCGDTHCDDPSKINIDFLCQTAEAVLRHFEIQEFHLVGHSMGGMTALQLAHRNPLAIRSFINIKGNLAPEDCFLSRQILEYPSDDMIAFFEAFVLRTRQAPFYSSALYAAGIRQRVQVDAIRGIFESMVHLSDHEDLLQMFLALPFPKMFMFGEQHASLSYLSTLKDGGVQLADIPASGHFPMYSNPVAMWASVKSFVERAEGAVSR